MVGTSGYFFNSSVESLQMGKVSAGVEITQDLEISNTLGGFLDELLD